MEEARPWRTTITPDLVHFIAAQTSVFLATANAQSQPYIPVEVGSLSGASRRLGVPLPTVSRKIFELEAHLKTRLLTRTTRRLALTDAGQSYVAARKRILEEVGEAERAATGEYSTPKGELVITAPIVFGRLHVLPVVTQFLQAYPEIDVRLVLSDHVANLLEDRVDLAVRIGALPDSSLVASRIGAIRRIVCGNPGYFAQRGAPQNPRELSMHDCVTYEGLMAGDRWVFPSGRSEITVPVHSRLIVTTAEAAIDAGPCASTCVPNSPSPRSSWQSNDGAREQASH
jgi:DNA-binding transcriptional LysR family regulator